jgi:hypothetical protein
MQTANMVAEQCSLPSARRLIVLVPDCPVDEVALGRRIWDLALLDRSDVLFLSAVKNEDAELRALHRIARLASVTQDPRIHVRTQLQFGRSWRQAVAQVYLPGDLLVCLADQRVRRRVLWEEPLCLRLALDLDIPVYALANGRLDLVRIQRG